MLSMKPVPPLCLCLLVWICGRAPLSGAEALWQVGVAAVDITPDYPVRLSGYGNRRTESEGVAQRLHAKALAFGSDADGPAVAITVDNVGVPFTLRDEVVRRLAAKTKVTGDCLAICSSHTHCAPMLAGMLPNIFSMDIPAEHLPAIERYTRELTDKIEQVALAALADRQPARLAWGVGKVEFAANRRVAFGSKVVDHDLPVLRVTTPEGKVRALFTSYACHCTTLDWNFIHADWAGCAQEALEREFPGAIALTAIGCGADQNPQPRKTAELVAQHGEALAAEAKRLVNTVLKPISGPLACRAKQIELAFDTPRTRAEWEAIAQPKGHPAAIYQARKNLARLDRGEVLPTALPYLVQTWSFGDDLAMVFLPGEVVVDYGLRLKREFDDTRLWVNGYSNDVPCYIPSRRVLEEGGYEGGFAMVYYDRPNKFAPEVEERIVAAVHELMPKEFTTRRDADAMPRGKTPAEALGLIHTRPELVVELAASEPLIADPVAIDWDARGRLWVVEQADYPNGIDGNWKPGGRVKILTDTDGDGRYDKAALFLEGIPFPTGITCWRGGVLLCAAPDILYAEDADGDGKADVVKKLFTGFDTSNYNARINSLALGLDNWMHGANGHLGGKIRSEQTGEVLDIKGRDLRIQPDTGALELVSGDTQQGRARDDWGNWFGCSNGRFIFQFPLPEHYLRRNPHVLGPAPSVNVPADENPGQLNPMSRSLARFNHPEALGQITSACGLGIYRDVLLGEEFYGNSFTGEVAHNLVRRYQLEPDGVTFAGHRPKDEQSVEFFASEDNWSRPVQVRTGPDGALYVVDMVRAVIEHTRWIPADKLAKLDVRTGDTMGRIYRISPRGVKLRPVRDLTALSTPELAAALDTPNGTVRDLVHLQLLHRADIAAAEPLGRLAASGTLPAVRVQALCALDGLHQLTSTILEGALADPHAAVRRHTVRLCENKLAREPALAAACLKLVRDPDLTVRYQLALSLGEWDDPRASAALAGIARAAKDDTWMRAAVLSSSARQPLRVLHGVLDTGGSGAGRDLLIGQLIATAAAEAKTIAEFAPLLEVLAPQAGGKAQSWQWSGLAQVLDALDRRKFTLTALPGAERTRQLFAAAHAAAMNPKTGDAEHETALKLFGRDPGAMDADLSALATFLKTSPSERVQKAALAALARTRSPRTAEVLLADWPQRGPAQRLAIIHTLLSREEWTAKLLEAIAAGTVTPGDVPVASRQALARHTNAALRQRAAELLPAGASGNRAAILAKYQPVATLRGDGAKGATVFTTVCASCHSFLGRGNDLGPNLSTFREKPAQDWLVAILDPNAAIEPRFTLYQVQTKDGRSLAGVITSETATSLVLGLPGGLRENLLRTDLAEIRASNISLMPEGLEAGLTPQDIADLIAFIKGGG